ncbi:hypothetical protein VTO42DRAFT_1750 [Malbranchea cinnamomea]
MTPPQSSQNPVVSTPPVRRSHSISSPSLASPPATVDQTLCIAYGASENLPTSTDLEKADEESLRKLAKELLIVAQEYRMSAAHFKLQNSLLSLTSSEAVKRAEVEQQLARREVEILQSEEYRTRQAVSTQNTLSRSVNFSELDKARDRIRELEQLNAILNRRLRRAKKLIEENHDKTELLIEENNRLKKRIRDNREHLTLMLDHGSLALSPRPEFLSPKHRSRDCGAESTKSKFNSVENEDPFAALLAADQVLSREPGSVASTPARNRDHRNYHSHSRGTHSLSSLPVTPARQRKDDNEERLVTPATKGSTKSYSVQQSVERNHRDRDSTISASDVDEAMTDEDVPASRASALATTMLRRHPGSNNQEAYSSNVGKSASLLQTTLFGHVRKAGIERRTEFGLKRKSSADDHQGSVKKLKTTDFLGINTNS